MFLGEHDGENVRRLGRVGGVFAAVQPVRRVVVDLPSEHAGILERAAFAWNRLPPTPLILV